MPQLQANGLKLEYETFGSANHPALLLIMGLGAQLTRWPIPFCERLADQGFHVIRFDNRDVGRSSWINTQPPELLMLMQSLMSGTPLPIPYTLDDMAADATGLLDALGIDAAHIVGASMGGMIGQLLAADHGPRTLSLTSIMSSSGNPALPRAAPEVLARITARPPDGALDTLLSFAVDTLQALSGRGYPPDVTEMRRRVLEDLQRGYNPAGVGRQIAAVTLSGDRRAKLRTIRVPTLVLHGEDDPLFPVQAGQDIAACIPGAQLKVLPGMGHDLPAPLYDTIVAAIVSNIRRAVRSCAFEPAGVEGR